MNVYEGYEGIWSSIKEYEGVWRRMKVYEGVWRSMKVYEGLYGGIYIIYIYIWLDFRKVIDCYKPGVPSTPPPKLSSLKLL